jgi:hypothetical protein
MFDVISIKAKDALHCHIWGLLTVSSFINYMKENVITEYKLVFEGDSKFDI